MESDATCDSQQPTVVSRRGAPIIARVMIEEYAQLLLEVAGALGVPARITSIHRTREKQAEIYRTRGPASSLPAAPPGTSTHEYGLAFDAVAVRSELQPVLGVIGEAIGLYWGGRFSRRDPVHFQLVSPADWHKVLLEVGLIRPFSNPKV